jgi:hypothetical protein
MTHPMPVDPTYASAPAENSSIGTANTFRIRRLGARPLVFAGTELAMAMSFTPELPYWYEMNVYRTDRQSFVLRIKHFRAAEGEADTCDAWEFDTLADLFDAVEAYDAARDVRFDTARLAAAPAAELAGRAMSLKAEVAAARAHFASLAGELFQEMDAAA